MYSVAAVKALPLT